ncbi:hypothetical protein BV25DRAFT_1830794 [Artomyces pyxidatus]|uniref:Uncharacterized protein n=1 Tax=Artomyces pyxidatus TaxID=48021 RepID=A0ACB8SMI9_9AGAM|nr:hypothetical protein BV25DRAFT_1830794 [Artomyces pyxidatus]
MLVFLLAYYAQTASGSPIASTALVIPSNITFAFSTPAALQSTDSGRTLYNIIWSSLATIFACVWTAVHRNIAGPSQGRLSRFLDMFGVVVASLLTPEWVLAGAFRQYLNARSLSKELEAARGEAVKVWEAKRRSLRQGRLNEGRRGTSESKDLSTDVVDEVKEKDVASLSRRTKLASSPGDEVDGEDLTPVESTLELEDGIGRLEGKWTARHGFFIIMGGFHYYKDGRPLFPLSRHDVIELVKTGDLVLPTDDEIRGWSQADTLSKLIAIIQTLWFVVQCIARRVEGLPIAQLEIMTLAYTTIAIVMYMCWWYKPLNVSSPVRVAAKRLPDPVPVEHRLPFLFALEIIMGTADRLVDMRQEAYVPPFYTGGVSGGPPINSADVFSGGIAVIAAMVFGAVHCAAWNYVFPSTVERRIWRVGAAIIVAAPGAMAIAAFLAVSMHSRGGVVRRVGDISLAAVFTICGPLYVAARLLLLVLSFTTLRALPPGAFQAEQWTLKIPHFT